MSSSDEDLKKNKQKKEKSKNKKKIKNDSGDDNIKKAGRKFSDMSKNSGKSPKETRYNSSPKTNEDSPVIGIDLGTTYSCVGIYQDGRVEIIPNEMGNKTTPSCVGFNGDARFIGDSAKNQCSNNPKNTIFDAKRLIGRLFMDPEIQKDLKHWPFQVIEGKNKEPLVQIQYKKKDKLLSAEEISSMILVKMKEIAETYLGKTVTKAVITVPAYFNDSQKQATIDAGKIAGLEVMRVIPEPTAAAIAYGLNKVNNKKEKYILVFDYGGGTFDVSLLKLDGGIFTVLAVNGDTHLGGEDLDNRLVEYFVKRIYEKTKIDISQNIKAVRRLREACEKAKRELSGQVSSNIDIPMLYMNEKKEPQDFTDTLSRSTFEDLAKKEFKKCLPPVKNVLKDAKINKDQVYKVVLVGGSSRIPKVQQDLIDFFDRKDILCKEINPDEAVAYGAAIDAFICNGGEDETTKELLLVDSTPLSLGVATSGDIMSVIIPRNTPIPCEKENEYSTNKDNQPSVLVKVYEGEREDASKNHLLGSFEIKGIPPAARGVPRIKVKFKIDQNGILTVAAENTESGNQKSLTVNANKGRFSEDDIKKALEDAKKFKEEDSKKNKTFTAKNNLQSYLQKVKSALEQNEKSDNKMSDEEKKEIEKLLKKTNQWIEENKDLKSEDYEEKNKKLDKKIQPILIKYAEKTKENNKTENTKVNIKVNKKNK